MKLEFQKQCRRERWSERISAMCPTSDCRSGKAGSQAGNILVTKIQGPKSLPMDLDYRCEEARILSLPAFEGSRRESIIPHVETGLIYASQNPRFADEQDAIHPSLVVG